VTAEMGEIARYTEWTYVQPQSIADVVPQFGFSNTRVTIAGINLWGWNFGLPFG
jgi:hypothetical protein